MPWNAFVGNSENKMENQTYQKTGDILLQGIFLFTQKLSNAHNAPPHSDFPYLANCFLEKLFIELFSSN